MTGSHNHIVSPKIYFGVFAALIIFTWITVAISKIDLGPLNTIAALSIAITKAVLVILFFMHVRYSTRLTKLVVVAAFLWLALLIGLVMADYVTRHWQSGLPWP
jgi:cytochrome c oxidase subunit IV